ncbi:MAG: DNA/RNA non-specific endonuclease [Eubacterium sp.]|nr:DNA/RNA non-specific endonuclease [Eubacterium sp.]
MNKKLFKIIPLLFIILVIFSACSAGGGNEVTKSAGTITIEETEKESSVESSSSSVSQSSFTFDLSQIPEYSNKAYYTLNNNIPDFDEKDKNTKSFEYYGKLDYLQRCTACVANISQELMPTEKRGSISDVKPTGWHSVRYDNVDGGSLYNRCHLIGYQLTGENANPNNLITGTRYMNAVGMLPFEEKTAKYIKSTNNHVLYRVTPVFKDRELVARGVQMEAYSVEDGGKGICYNVYCYNVQPGIEINYTNGDSKKSVTEPSQKTGDSEQDVHATYYLNVKSKKFHRPDCPSVNDIKEENKKRFSGSRQSLIDQGYSPCGSCKP